MSAVSTSVAAAAVALSGLSALVLCGRTADQGADIERLEGLVANASARGGAPPGEAELARLSGGLARAEERLARLEASPRRAAAVPEEAAARLEAPAAPAREAAPAAAAAGGTPAERAELEQLLAHFGSTYDWDASSDELARFYELAKKTGLIEAKIGELEAAVAADPRDLDLRMELADTYVAKLMTIQGPEQGLWGSRAEEQWREVSTRDPDHWGAAFALGENYAYYPDVMGKTDDAIAHLERARAIQERAPQGAEHVRTYLSLARLYQRKGDLDQARSVLRAGLRYHPGDAALGAALDGLGG